MKINIDTSGVEFDNGLNHFATCCAAFELGPQRDRIDTVRIKLAQMPQTSNPKNQHCLVEVDLFDGNTLTTRDMDLDMHIAIYRALEHAGWMCARWLSSEELEVGDLPVLQPQSPNPVEPYWAA